MTKAVAYIRVSSDEQVKNTQGLDIQREELKEYAEKNNIDLVKIFRGSRDKWSKRYKQATRFE